MFALALGGVAALVGLAFTTHRPTASREFFGVNAGTLFDEPVQFWSLHLAAMERAGIEVVRTDASWARAEPEPPVVAGRHSYRWLHADAIASALAAHHIRWYPIIDYSAPWAASQPGNFRSPPASPSEYFAYARALASRYGTNGSFWKLHLDLPRLPVRQWEVWNEENGGYFWSPRPDAARYAELYRGVREAIHNADPGAGVVFGGLVPNAQLRVFLAEAFGRLADAHSPVDAVAFHPYGPTAHDSATSVRDLRAILTGLGRARLPIEVTEVGWTTRGRGSISEAAKAVDFARLPVEMLDARAGVTRVLPYAWTTSEKGADAEAWFGLFHPDASPTPAGTAYKNAIRRTR